LIFSRKRGRGSTGRHAARRRERDEFGVPVEDDEETPVRDTGPFDVDDEYAWRERLDLGSLRVPVPAGVELRVQADSEGQIQQVVLVSGESALQLGVFAAPKTEGIWDEVRADIRKQLFSDGVAVEEATGEYGAELRARVRTPEGLTDLRFVGVDGPRWMVRAVYQGTAAVDEAAARPLDEVLHGLVVDRGGEAMPVREPLPLRLPREMAEKAAAEGAAAAAEGASSGAGADGEAGAVREAGGTAKPRPSPTGRPGGSRRRPSPRPRRG
jgi:hypothetical protein